MVKQFMFFCFVPEGLLALPLCGSGADVDAEARLSYDAYCEEDMENVYALDISQLY